MAKIKDLTREIVKKAKDFESDVVEGNYVTLDVSCPNCGALQLKEDYRTFHCETCDFRLFKNIASRQLTPDEVIRLIADRKVGPLEGFRSKTGRPFSAILVLNTENKAEFAFENSGSSEQIKIDPTNHVALGPCQVCKIGRVYDIGTGYVCENVSKQTCIFKLSKTILQREIPPDQVKKMLLEGKSDVLKRFISKKGRPFDAALQLQDGKIAWEFAKHEQRKKSAKS